MGFLEFSYTLEVCRPKERLELERARFLVTGNKLVNDEVYLFG
jgi:hypothetical protein